MRCPKASLAALLVLAGCAEEPPEGKLVRAFAAKGDVASIRRALIAGAKIDEPDSYGYTPLAIAAFNGQREAVRTLMEFGANPQASHASFRPLTLAVSQGDAGTVALLIELGARAFYPEREEQPLTFATDPRVIEVLLRNGGRINLQAGATKETALHRAAAIAREDAVRLLLREGADPTLADSAGFTPLHNVCRIRNADLLPGGKEGVRNVLRMLLAAGADPNAQDRFLSTPLHHAARSAVFGPEELATLVRAGTRFDQMNGSGRTPRQIAEQNGYAKDRVRLAVLSGDLVAVQPK